MTVTAPCLLLAAASWAASLTGVVAEGDIYDGERIAGASVWIDGVASTTTSSEGLYLIEGLAAGDYTVRAVADGYLEGACARSIESSGEFWCSIALQVDPGGDDTGSPPDDTGAGPDDTGAGTDDSAGPGDTASTDTGPRGVFPPGAWRPLYGCRALPAAPAAWLALLALAGAWPCGRRIRPTRDTQPASPRSTP